MEIYQRKRVKTRPVVLNKIILYTSFKILAPLSLVPTRAITWR